MSIVCEVCIDSSTGGRIALECGADRLEVCANLKIGGTTPSAGLIKQLRAVTNIPLHILIRPRGGDFIFDATEVNTMLEDIAIAKDLGADGIVCGALTEHSQIDLNSLEKLLTAAAPLSFTFHRAFDLCRNPMEALKDFNALGIDRVLTSGQASNVLAGAENLRHWIDAAENVIIMAGGGITPDNVSALLKQVPLQEIHFSGTTLVPARFQPALSMGKEAPAEESARLLTDPLRLMAIFQQVREVSSRKFKLRR